MASTKFVLLVASAFFEVSPEASVMDRRIKLKKDWLLSFQDYNWRLHVWGQEPRLTHKPAIKLLSLSCLVIAELEGLILVLFLEDRFKSLHKPHHFTQNVVLRQGQAL